MKMKVRVETLFAYVLIIIAGVLVFFDSVSLLLLILSNLFVLVGLAIGGAAIAVLGVTRRGRVPLHPAVAIGVLLMALVYRLFAYILVQSLAQTLALPPYLPNAWVIAISGVGTGVLIGAGFPFLLFAIVSEAFYIPGQAED